jgi:hypothetical protein
VFFNERKNSRDHPSTLTGGHSRASEPAIVSTATLPRSGDGYVNQLNPNVSRGTLGTSGGSKKGKKRKNSLSSTS